MKYQELKEKYWNNVGDDKLFPNHSDQDIWEKGFKDGWDACVEYMAQRYKDDLKHNNSTATKHHIDTFTNSTVLNVPDVFMGPDDGC